jgi:GTP-binding protein HflX
MLDKKDHQYEKAVLVGVVTQNQDEKKLKEYMDELEFLAFTAGATVEKRFTQKLTQPDSKLFVGKGKAEEIKNYVTEHGINTIIFDDELSPSQLKNLEREIEVKILDRTNLILDIFAQRAQTSYARTQVELAQYQYLVKCGLTSINRKGELECVVPVKLKLKLTVELSATELLC